MTGTPRKRVRRWHIAALLLALLVALYAWLVSHFLPPWLLQRANQSLQSAFGVQLQVGQIKLNPFTWAATLRDVQLNAPGGSRARLERVQVNLQLAASLLGPWTLDELKVQRMQLRVQASDWARWRAHTASSADADPPQVLVHRLQLQDAEIQWADETGGWQLHEVALMARRLGNLDLRADVDFSARLQPDAATQQSAVHLKSEGWINPGTQHAEAHVSAASSHTNWLLAQIKLPEPLQAEVRNWGIEGEIDWRGTDALRVRNLSVSIEDIVARLDAQILSEFKQLRGEGLALDWPARTLHSGRWHWRQGAVRLSPDSLAWLNSLSQNSADTQVNASDWRFVWPTLQLQGLQLSWFPEPSEQAAWGVDISTGQLQTDGTRVQLDTRAQAMQGGEITASGEYTPRTGEGAFKIQGHGLSVPGLAQLLPQQSLRIDSGELQFSADVAWRDNTAVLHGDAGIAQLAWRQSAGQVIQANSVQLPYWRVDAARRLIEFSALRVQAIEGHRADPLPVLLHSLEPATQTLDTSTPAWTILLTEDPENEPQP